MVGPGVLDYFVYEAYSFSLTIGYERKFRKDFTLGISGSRTWRQEGEYTHAILYSVAPELRYYPEKSKNKGPALWVGASLPFEYSAGSDFIDKYFYGVGVMAGAKIFLSHKHKWFIDLGGSVSVNKYVWVNRFECYKGKDFPVFHPKLFFLLGSKF
jgi:hypothetical protein